MLSLIVAKSKNNVIGKDNKLLWHIPDDLRRFKELTTNHNIIMGRKTFDQLERKADSHTAILFAHTKHPLINQLI